MPHGVIVHGIPEHIPVCCGGRPIERGSHDTHSLPTETSLPPQTLWTPALGLPTVEWREGGRGRGRGRGRGEEGGREGGGKGERRGRRKSMREREGGWGRMNCDRDEKAASHLTCCWVHLIGDKVQLKWVLSQLSKS